MEAGAFAAGLSIPTNTTTTLKVKMMTTAPFIFPFTSTSTSTSQMLVGSRPTTSVGIRRLLCLPSPHVADPKLPHPRGVRGVICMAGPGAASELSHDAPFAVAIAASMLHSLLTPPPPPPQQDEQDVIDVKFPVMTIISLIPFFNWLSWVFAFMDTGNRRYAVYAAVYLAPYLRTNFSLSPDESWLPIASILLCIIHIQLEASIRSGDLDAFAFFHEAAARFGLIAKSKDNHSTTQRKTNKGRSMKLPLSQSQLKEWEDHKKPSVEENGIEDSDDLDDGTDHH